MESAIRYGWFILVGAATYWGTDALIQWTHPPHRIWISLLTFGVPSVVGGVWYRLFRKARYENYPKAFPLFMLLGIWALGPLAIAVTMQFLGGTILDIDKLQGFLMVWAAFPASTFMMSTYSGSLGGLIISTILLLILSLVASSKRRASNKRLQIDAATPRD
jgi:hypothetical protein